MLTRKIISIFLLLLFAQALTFASNDFPYGTIILKIPAQEDPYPGLGNNFSSLGKGIDSILWNPAGLAKVITSEAHIGFSSAAAAPLYNKKYDVKDSTFEVGVAGGSSAGFKNAILYTADLNAVDLATREYTGHLNYSTFPTGLSYKQAITVSDNFSFGISTRGETGLSISLGGSFPAQWKSDVDLYNVSNFMDSGISTNNGKLTYTYTPPGMSPYTYTSEASVWSGFLNQTQRIPFAAISDSHNDINVQSDLTLTGAARWGSWSVGANLTPISATANIDNSIRAIVKEGTSDVFFYVPNFDPNNESEVLQWTMDQNQYGTEAGYKKRYFRVPAGETIAEAKYKGFFTASTARIDLGAMYELGNVLTIGLALENINNATLDFKGNGLVAYVNSRISTVDANNLLDPSGTDFNFFSDTFSPVKGTENIGFNPQIPSRLPQRFKIGATLRKPFLITIDYEQQTNPFSFRYQKDENTYQDLTVSDIRFIRAGLESQVFALPLWIRSGVTLMLKPTISGASAEAQDNFDKAFQFGMLPFKFDLGTSLDLWGAELGNNLGVSLMPIFCALQLDTLNQDSGKIGYYNMFLKKGNWQVTYLSIIDPGSTAAARSVAANKDDWFSFLKWMSTLTVSVRF